MNRLQQILLLSFFCSLLATGCGEQNDVQDSKEVFASYKNESERIVKIEQLFQQVRETDDRSLYIDIQRILNNAEKTPKIIGLQALLHIGKHDFAKAQELILPIVQKNPQDVFLLGILSDTQIELGQYDEAQKTFLKLRQLAPNNFGVLTRLSYLQQIMGDRSAAIASMEKALINGSSAKEHMAWGFTELGFMQLAVDRNKAKEAFRNARVYRPNYVKALVGLSRHAVGEDDLKQAQVYADQAFQESIDPHYAAYAAGLALIRDDVKEQKRVHQGTLEAFKDMRQKAEENIDFEEVEFLVSQGLEVERVLDLSVKSYKRQPNIFTAANLAEVYVQQNNLEEARKFVGIATITNPAFPTPWHAAALLEQAEDNDQEYKNLRERVLKEDPLFYKLRP